MEIFKRRLIVGLMASAMGITIAAASEMPMTYEVTVTNITRGQIIAPPAVIAHSGDYHMFALGMPASPELQQLAEAGNSGAVTSAAAGLNAVYATALGSGGIAPGASQTMVIQTTEHFPFVSVGAMLATTNDGFMAVDGAHVPKRGSVKIEAVGYDAGTEANSEDCTFVPGPPCGDKRHNAAIPEGYVHVHAGIHIGGGGLMAAQHDWRNPVAMIEIKRIN